MADAVVVKSGYLRKLKKGKRKFVVLRKESSKTPACLQIYETEKKWKSQQNPKSVVNISSIFNVNKQAFSKCEYAVAVYTYTDSLFWDCENQADQESWNQTILDLLLDDRARRGSAVVRSCFEYCWDTTVAKFEGGQKVENYPRSGSIYRFCLTDDDIFLVKRAKSLDEPEECWQFELAFVPSYGLQGDTLSLTLGRSTVTGSGTLWMRFDDVATSESVFKTLQRTLEERKVRRKSISGLVPRSSTISRDRSSSVTQERQRGFSENDKTLNLKPQAISYLQARNSQISDSSGEAAVVRSFSHSHSSSLRPPSGLPAVVSLASSSGHCSSDSMASSASIPEEPQQHGRSFVHGKTRCSSIEAVYPNPPIKEEGSNSGEYLPMQGSRNSLTAGGDVGGDYVSMEAASKPSAMEDHYMFMAATGRKPTPVSSNANSYTPMGPSGKQSYVDDGFQSRQQSWNLEEVRSYISDSGESFTESISSRSYSVGARPDAAMRTAAASTVLNTQPLTTLSGSQAAVKVLEDRRRAHSFGNWNRPGIMQKYRRHYAAPLDHLSPGNDSSESRPRSESFSSSSGRQSLSGIFAHRRLEGGRQHSHRDDLVELDFGMAIGMSKSPTSSSFGSSESLPNRSRTGSLAGNQRSWSPKVELIEEANYGQSPSSRLVAKLCSPTAMSDDYVPMFNEECAAKATKFASPTHAATRVASVSPQFKATYVKPAGSTDVVEDPVMSTPSARLSGYSLRQSSAADDDNYCLMVSSKAPTVVSPSGEQRQRVDSSTSNATSRLASSQLSDSEYTNMEFAPSQFAPSLTPDQVVHSKDQDNPVSLMHSSRRSNVVPCVSLGDVLSDNVKSLSISSSESASRRSAESPSRGSRSPARKLFGGLFSNADKKQLPTVDGISKDAESPNATIAALGDASSRNVSFDRADQKNISKVSSTSNLNATNATAVIAGAASNAHGQTAASSSTIAKASSTAELALEYVTLDLPKSAAGGNSPMKSPTGSINSSSSSTTAPSVLEAGLDTSTTYAEIDMAKFDVKKKCNVK